jgi:5-dehydro-2-deoxygluconokinase
MAAYDVLAMGRSSIDLYAHQIGVPITDVTSFDAYVGGCPTNISVGTRRLGLRSALLTAVGDDQVGDFVLAFLEREGIDTRFVPRKRGHRTSAVIMAIQPPDRFPLTFYRDHCADRELTEDDVRNAPIAESAIVVMTGTGLSHEPSRSATRLARTLAARAGRTVFIDLDYRAHQWGARADYAGQIADLASGADIIVGTEEEVVAAADHDDLDTAIARVLTWKPGALIIKRGAAGATIRSASGSSIDVRPFHVTVLNVLGAGDAFASGVIAGLNRGWPLERAVRLGNATGAIVVTRHGCANFMPTADEVEAFVKEQGGW